METISKVQQHKPISFFLFFLPWQINLAMVQGYRQADGATSPVLLSHYQNHFIPIYNVQYMVWRLF